MTIITWKARMPDSTEDRNNIRILLAEDSPENRLLVQKALQPAGYRIDVAVNGKEAVDKFGLGAYDLVLMDLQMPEMDGFEATGVIRGLDSGSRVPIIAFSALPADEYREKCLASGMDEYVQKPFEPKALLSAIDRLVDTRPLVLIVDDAEESRRLLEAHMAGLGKYRMASASNGVEAIKAVRQFRPGVILMDMEMPVMDGYTAARAIKGLNFNPEIPVIAMTAHEGDKEIARCLKAGCSGYLHKPVKMTDLASALSEHLKDSGGVISSENADYVFVNADISELIPGYLENRRKDSLAIAHLLEEGNIQEIRRLGHSMSGSGGGYGFREISRIGKAIEKAALAENRKALERLTRRLSAYLETVRVVVKKEE